MSNPPESDEQTEPWGVKVDLVDISDVEIPAGMQRAIAGRAEAERERRARVIHSRGEVQAAEKPARPPRSSRPPPRPPTPPPPNLGEPGSDGCSTVVFPFHRPSSDRTRIPSPLIRMVSR
ncbi:SPFH domain-containing protein [Nocardia sp. NPDC051990]|uniref:SPFH domain-containing protein n=1 Tax=Nocardia sp. NPDC051990 TaxID=3155285 RepID=UPI003426A4AC